MITPSGARANDALREQFPSLATMLYVNHAAVSPWPRRTAAAVEAFAQENLREGPAGYRNWIARERRLREQLAQLTGAASPGDIALLKNTTEGICTVAFGLEWNPGDNVVLPADEFSSNRLPWEAQAQHGVEVRRVDIRAAAHAERALIEAMDHRTRVLSVSAVQWSDGFRLDLDMLGEACQRLGSLFFVDAIQQLGALPIDVSRSQVSFLAADAHKWLLGPEGIAVFFAAASARPSLRLNQVGWHMYENPWEFDRADRQPAASARRFEAGTPNSLGQVALSASLDVLAEHGMERVAQRVLRNTAHLMDRLPTLPGVHLVSCADPPRRSGIVSFACHSPLPSALHHSLARQGIHCALRLGSVRLSPHFYQGEVEMERLLDGIDRELRA